MLNGVLAATLPVLLVFGLYHLLTWFNVAGINRYVFWKRVAWTSGISHLLLITGFFAFSYLDYRANRFAGGMSYGAFLFDRSAFWSLMTIFDILPMVTVLGLFALLDGAGVAVPAVPATLIIVYVLGTAQWYLVGGAAGALLERFWSGLKSPEEEDPEDF